MQSVVIIGAEGQLGSELCRQLGPRAIPLSRQQLDITDARQTELTLGKLRDERGTAEIAAVINTAAYTKVDLAQQQPDECYSVNVEGVSNLANACNRYDLTLVQISSDYVFGAGLPDTSASTGKASGTQPAGTRSASGTGPQPYCEADPTAPQGVYAKSKLLGEQAAMAATRHLIIRTCGLYGPRSKPSQANFVDTMLRLGVQRERLQVVDDQICSPSYVVDVAQAMLFLIDSQRTGLYHVVNQGSVSWCDFAREIFRLARLNVIVEPITTAQYNAAAPRPSFSVLDTSKYNGLDGPTLRTWQAAVAAYIAKLAQPSART